MKAVLFHKHGNLQAAESVRIVGAFLGENTASIQVARLAGAQVFVIGKWVDG